MLNLDHIDLNDGTFSALWVKLTSCVQSPAVTLVTVGASVCLYSASLPAYTIGSVCSSSLCSSLCLRMYLNSCIHLISTCVSWDHLWGIFVVTPAAGAGTVDRTAEEVVLGLVGRRLCVPNDRVA